MVKPDRLLLCDCDGSMKLDAKSATSASGAGSVKTCSNLCTEQLDVAAEALGLEGKTCIACGQQSQLFEDLLAEIGGPGQLLTTDIRDRAGWTDEANAYAKQAALLAEAMLDRPSTPLRDIISSGVCLIAGKSEDVLPVAEQLCESLSVTCLFQDVPEEVVPTDKFEVAIGQIVRADGAFAGFSIIVDGFAALNPSGRGAGRFGPKVNGAKSECDIIIDLTGRDPLFPAHHKRDGYFSISPRDVVGVQKTVHAASALVGEFEKPLYIRFDAQICAHSRASQDGCNRCLNVCPTGAIVPNGETVAIDPAICAGCGACAAVCPSGASSYDDPPVEFLFQRLKTLAATYLEFSGGQNPGVLFHDETHGAELIELSARFSRGLPADVIPVAVPNVECIGHAELLAALGVGFGSAAILLSPATDTDVVEQEVSLAQAIVEGAAQKGTRLSVIEAQDPDRLAELLYDNDGSPCDWATILPLGNRRDVTRLAAGALAEGQPVIALPKGAPYGAITVDTDACTMCLACVSLCPVGALTDAADKPQIGLQEAACLQCGICKSTCPENAISLSPRLNLENAALSPVVLNQEEPFDCISCGTPFGVKSTIDRIVEKLKDNHSMFTNSDNVKLIQMCDDCRVNAQYHQESSPFQAGPRPKVRTTQDYLDERKKH